MQDTAGDDPRGLDGSSSVVAWFVETVWMKIIGVAKWWLPYQVYGSFQK